MKIYPVFYAEKLYKDSSNLLLRQSNLELLLLEFQNSETEYKVQAVLIIKLLRNKFKYKVQWKGWDLDLE